ncbi:MAG: hypothetical protein EBV06_09490 [Planctomycetia bacterium]|nr:hypothetical protein [Planctomycetia bacterium]
MKRITLALCAVFGLALTAGTTQASWGHLTYSGYQPWWNIFAKRYKCLTPEEERLQKFWHDYYHSLKTFYKHLDAIDWVAYYKNHGYAINAGPCGPGGCGRINYAPVFVSPTMQWAIPAGATGGPPVGPGFGGPIPMGAMMPPGGFGGPIPMMGGMPGPIPTGLPNVGLPSAPVPMTTGGN